MSTTPRPGRGSAISRRAALPPRQAPEPWRCPSRIRTEPGASEHKPPASLAPEQIIPTANIALAVAGTEALTENLLNLTNHRGPGIRHRDVQHAQLHAFAALPAVHAKRSRYMQRLTAMLGQRVAEL